MKVYLAQLKCPSGHCVLGAYGEFESLKEADAIKQELLAGFTRATDLHLMNPYCGLCKSRDLAVDIRETPWRTIEEARPVMEEMERRQLETARWLKQTRN